MLLVGVSILASSSLKAETVRYLVEIDNTWSTTTHPGAFPTDAHFSWFGGGVHNENISLWQVGELATPGMVRMAETGVTTSLANEVKQHIAENNAFRSYDIKHWFCPSEIDHSSCGELSFMIEASEEFSKVSLVSMLGPSPDWFVGTESLDLRINGIWQKEIHYELFPYDGGSRSNNTWFLGGPKNDPQEPIYLITEESGHLVGPDSLGVMTLRHIPAGDFDLDGTADHEDIDTLSQAIRRGTRDLSFDLDGNNQVDQLDRDFWVHDIKQTFYGDANLDGKFLSDDFVRVFQFGQYEDEIDGNSGWLQGDWNGDGDFGSRDFVVAFQDGGFERDERVAHVPEPTFNIWLIPTLLGVWRIKRRY